MKSTDLQRIRRLILWVGLRRLYGLMKYTIAELVENVALVTTLHAYRPARSFQSSIVKLHKNYRHVLGELQMAYGEKHCRLFSIPPDLFGPTTKQPRPYFRLALQSCSLYVYRAFSNQRQMTRRRIVYRYVVFIFLPCIIHMSVAK